MDLIMGGNSHFPTLYLYRPDGNCTNFFQAKVLKEALSKALVTFYPVAGRLGRDEKGRVQIDCNGEGVLFVEAETDSAAGELGDFLTTGEVQQLTPRLDYSGGISSYPLFVAQVTRFKCGAVCLGIGWHHYLADGTGALQFVNSWSALARGLSIALSPVFDRSVLSPGALPSPTFPHLEYHPNPPLHTPSHHAHDRDPAMAMLTLTLHQLNALKAKAALKRNQNSKTKYTTFEVLAAHIWRCTCKARCLADEQETKIKLTVSGRSRLVQPPVPRGYFGNVVFFSAVIARAGELISEPIGLTVERIWKAIERMDDEYMRSAIDYLEGKDEEEIGSMMESPTTWASPNLKMNSWSRLPFYEADFGWGAPWLIRGATTSVGKVHIQPCPTNDGSYSLDICLESAHHLQSFQKLFYDF